METKANYVLIGMFTLLAATAVLLFGLWSAKYAAESSWNEYLVRFSEPVTGLSNGSPVLFNGVNIGRVAELKLNPADVREVLAIIRVDSDVPVHQDTVATIRLTGLTGAAAIQLSGGKPHSPLLKSNDHHGPPEIQAVTSPLLRLLESSEGIIATANKIVLQIDSLLGDENVDNLGRIIADLRRFTSSVVDPDGDLNRLLANGAKASQDLPGLIEQLQRFGRKLNSTLSRLDRDLLGDLPEVRRSIDETLDGLQLITSRVDGIIAGNEESLTQIGEVGMRQIDGGLEELRRLIRDLSNLIRQIERNPSRFLLGGEQPEEYQPK
ncbi:MAG: MCE family protein [Xanthomonadaceae bacterium]|nr:MCE family protein [Xanthomonadaceae bacterium]